MTKPKQISPRKKRRSATYQASASKRRWTATGPTSFSISACKSFRAGKCSPTVSRPVKRSGCQSRSCSITNRPTPCGNFAAGCVRRSNRMRADRHANGGRRPKRSDMQRKRAPNGYRIQRWADGFYHLYGPAGGCIDEFLTRSQAIDAALEQAEAARQDPELAARLRLVITRVRAINA